MDAAVLGDRLPEVTQKPFKTSASILPGLDFPFESKLVHAGKLLIELSRALQLHFSGPRFPVFITVVVSLLCK